MVFCLVFVCEFRSVFDLWRGRGGGGGGGVFFFFVLGGGGGGGGGGRSLFFFCQIGSEASTKGQGGRSK
eukprot:COSAG05_NODE_691_length_7896_cov_83.318549_1_plen_69_part_00